MHLKTRHWWRLPYAKQQLKWKETGEMFPSLFTIHMGRVYCWLFMIKDFLIMYIYWSVKCTLKNMSYLESSFFQEVEWFQPAQKNINQEPGASVLYLPKPLPLVRACVNCDRWLQLACLYLCVVCWVHVRLSERTLLEYIGVGFCERLQ